MIDKLPEINGAMPIAQYACIEILSILVEQNVITESQAVDKYIARKKKFGATQWI